MQNKPQINVGNIVVFPDEKSKLIVSKFKKKFYLVYLEGLAAGCPV